LQQDEEILYICIQLLTLTSEQYLFTDASVNPSCYVTVNNCTSKQIRHIPVSEADAYNTK